MPPTKRGRKADEEEPEDVQTQDAEDDEGDEPDEEELEEQVEEELPDQLAGPGTNIDIGQKQVKVTVPRDGNEGKALQAVGRLLDELT
jgi:hypothetical protein